MVFDLFEMFDWSLLGFDYNLDNFLFVMFIVMFRVLVGSVIFVVIFIWFGMNDMWSCRVFILLCKELKDCFSGIFGL